MSALRFDVLGTPAGQGSMRGFAVNGRAVLTADNPAKLHPWRTAVTLAAQAARQAAGWETVPRPTGVRVDIVFRIARPRSHYGTGRNADTLRPGAPRYPTTKPDVDKLERAAYDALTFAGVYEDDAQVIAGSKTKLYAGTLGPAQPGATITITAVPT